MKALPEGQREQLTVPGVHLSERESTLVWTTNTARRTDVTRPLEKRLTWFESAAEPYLIKAEIKRNRS
jgi:hypothetical protein